VRTTDSAPAPRTIIAAAVFATIATVFPGFLVGALSVQVSGEFDVAEATYGWGLGGFFLSATLGSMVLGRVAQRVGPRRQVTAALFVSIMSQIFIATMATSFWLFVGALAVAGLANSANQSAINLLISQAKLPRLGFAIALKQSGMPGASLLGGLAVPVVALTIGWRWAYVIGAFATATALWNVRRVIAPVGRLDRSIPKSLTPRRTLVIAAIGFGCMAFAAGALNGWIVSSGVESGIGEGRAGLLLSLGAAFGIAVRLFVGTRIDSLRASPMLFAAGLSMFGAAGIAILSMQSATSVLIGTVLAFGAGWVWPVFTNFGVVRSNRDAAAAATGVTQTGVYIGVFAGPLLSGYLIEGVGYSTMWVVTAADMAIGALITAAVAREF
jgi:predicted MFS family arabinose efflux permease